MILEDAWKGMNFTYVVWLFKNSSGLENLPIVFLETRFNDFSNKCTN